MFQIFFINFIKNNASDWNFIKSGTFSTSTVNFSLESFTSWVKFSGTYSYPYYFLPSRFLFVWNLDYIQCRSVLKSKSDGQLFLCVIFIMYSQNFSIKWFLLYPPQLSLIPTSVYMDLHRHKCTYILCTPCISDFKKEVK